MSECCNPAGYRHLFNEKEASRSLRQYEKQGLDNMAQSMVDYLSSRGMSGRTVLEAGGGIGAIQVELLKAGAASAANVELSGGYEATAADLLAKQGLSDRVDRHVGDFTEISGDLEADDVVMNRVICCYPFWARLLEAAMSSSRRFVAYTFPRDRLGSKVVLTLRNTYCRIRGVDFRAFIHPPDAIVEAVKTGGFDLVFEDRDFVWNAAVFERTV